MLYLNIGWIRQKTYSRNLTLTNVVFEFLTNTATLGFAGGHLTLTNVVFE